MEHGFVLLGGNTVAPSGLCARLCHAFLVLFVLLFGDVTTDMATTLFQLKVEVLLHDLATKRCSTVNR